MTQLKDGQVWRTRNGNEITLRYDEVNGWFEGSFGGMAYGDEEGHTTEEGRMVFGTEIGEHGLDLVELIRK